MLLSSCQEALVNKFAAIGDHCHMLEAKIWFLAKLMFCFGFLNHDDVFDSNAKATIFIVARLIRNDIPRCKWNFRVLYSGSDANRSFMYIEIRAHSVTGTVSVVKAFFLQNC